jgi:hypothetical protein
MKNPTISILILLIAAVFIGCEHDKDIIDNDNNADFSETYCLNIENLEMTIVQTGDSVTFTLQTGLLTNGTGTIHGDTLRLTAITTDSATFTSVLVFSGDRQSFSGSFELVDAAGTTAAEGILTGNKGECAKYDIETHGIPKFVRSDYTQLSKIEMISKFRSSAGHSFTDGNEICRSMKHYYSAYDSLRENNTVAIYSPVDGTISSVSNDGHGASIGLNNKQIQIKPDEQPAFVFILFHCDLVSSAVVTGKKIQAGELLGYGRLYYEDLGEHAGSFDIAVWVNTPSGLRLVSYFETLEDVVFNTYISRGAVSRQDFIITKEMRDADPLECDGEAFLTQGNLDNWVILHKQRSAPVQSLVGQRLPRRILNQVAIKHGPS